MASRPAVATTVPLQGALILVAIVLGAAAAYEAAIAAGWLSIGALPGEGAPGSGSVLVAALAACVAGSAILASAPVTAGEPPALAVLAAAAFVVARFYTYDPYYAPTLRRMSEGGYVAGSWIVVLGAAAAATALISARRPRVGARIGAVLLLLCAATAVAEGIGH